MRTLLLERQIAFLEKRFARTKFYYAVVQLVCVYTQNVTSTHARTVCTGRGCLMNTVFFNTAHWDTALIIDTVSWTLSERASSSWAPILPSAIRPDIYRPQPFNYHAGYCNRPPKYRLPPYHSTGINHLVTVPVIILPI